MTNRESEGLAWELVCMWSDAKKGGAPAVYPMIRLMHRLAQHPKIRAKMGKISGGDRAMIRIDKAI